MKPSETDSLPLRYCCQAQQSRKMPVPLPNIADQYFPFFSSFPYQNGIRIKTDKDKFMKNVVVWYSGTCRKPICFMLKNKEAFFKYPFLDTGNCCYGF